MNTISYSVLQYRHNRALDEAINIGVLAYSPSERKAAFEYDQHYRQLSALYRNFDSAGFRSCLRRLGSRIGQLNRQSEGRLIGAFEDRIQTSEELLRSIWPDYGSSLVGSPAKFTVAADVKEEARSLFDRLVEGMRPGSTHRGNRKDEDVWETIMKRLDHVEGLAARFHPKTIDAEIELDYVIEQGDSKLIAVEPVAFDYLNGSSVRERTFELVGKCVGLAGTESFKEMFVVVGEVQRNSEVRETVKWAESYIANLAPKTTILAESNVQPLFAALR